ncbi:tapasin-related protein-like [Acanthochromis polyacanthus]|uniref:tapasin-related protein-like n=1 Tax=Acanthochromis polyacanthus TaxID=80966 RepID=UPI002234270E|nr:tapasin-related protein-like [Acanthochromis polyacanthus]
MDPQQNMKLMITILVVALRCRGSSAGSTTELSVLMGSEATLRCVFDRQWRPVEWSDLTVEWNLVDKHAGKRVVYTFEDGSAHVNRGGSVVNETGLRRSDASLQLFNVTVRDEGVYTCRIITPVVYTESTALEVLAPLQPLYSAATLIAVTSIISLLLVTSAIGAASSTKCF